MTKLSPAALTVWSAFLDRYEWEVTTEELFAVAAALRAAADQLGESPAPGAEFEDLYPRIIEVDELLAIADELEAQ